MSEKRLPMKREHISRAPPWLRSEIARLNAAAEAEAKAEAEVVAQCRLDGVQRIVDIE